MGGDCHGDCLPARQDAQQPEHLAMPRTFGGLHPLRPCLKHPDGDFQKISTTWAAESQS